MYTDKDAGDFFDRFSEAFDTLYDEQRSPFMRWVDRKYRSDMFIRFSRTFEAFGDLQGKTVLDIGCGSGPFLLEALKRGAGSVTGIDPAPGMLELVKHRLAGAEYSGKFKLINSLFPAEGIEKHDHAIVMGVMDYVNDPGAFINALRPLVSVSVAVSFPSKHWFRTPLRKFRYKLRRCPLFFYDEQEIRELFTNAGFGSVDIYPIPGAGMDFHMVAKP